MSKEALNKVSRLLLPQDRLPDMLVRGWRSSNNVRAVLH